ncbi:hypothetical protein BIY24_05445 [Halobacteriovorax marinus]|uniref:hypothetical protein n=1 Tax=Halobacteriovorax marinus TaxID=97084 RepID=UPI000BC2ED60|nr:hypothetical protein [Halobacteriovorax marinus]ATH07402.1 hypothetical protein BIY24_05445 [Halobacteriovorax marinus]
MQSLEILHEKETSLIGRDNGREFLVKLEKELGSLEELEKANPTLEFKFPREIITMNKSFFLGAFAKRAIALGKQAFLEKYDFSSSEYINLKISSHIDYALKNASMDSIVRNG